MTSTADTLLDLIRARWSPYVYAETPVPENTLRNLFDAARWTPSSRNEQPWRFLVGRKGEGDTHARLLGTLAERNQQWAHRAPVLGLVAVREAFHRNEQPNRSARYDAGAAMMTLALAAEAQGLAVHQMAGFDPEAARAAFAIPEGFAPVVAFALGTPAEAADDVPEALASRDAVRRGRRCLADLVFTDAWEAPRWPEALDGCDDEGA